MQTCSVFECSICSSHYNRIEHKPLALPCGHVYCYQCLHDKCEKGDTFCPVDKTQYSSNVSDLPCCFAILANLPKQKASRTICNCKRHPDKRIKFICETHKLYLCTSCVLEHTGPGHKVSAFEVNHDEIKGTVAGLGKRLQAMLHKMQKYNDRNEKKLEKFEQSMIKQQEMLDLAYSRAFRLVCSKKKELSKIFEVKSKEQTSAIIVAKQENLQKVKQLMHIKETLGKALKTCEGNNIIQKASEEISEVEVNMNVPRNIDSRLFWFSGNVTAVDKSEVIRKSGKSLTRAHSTSNKHRKNTEPVKPDLEKSLNKTGLTRIINQITKPEVGESIKTHRKETVSPRKDLISPTYSESTVASLGVTVLSAKAGCLDSSVEDTVVTKDVVKKIKGKTVGNPKPKVKHESMLQYKSYHTNKVQTKRKPMVNHCRIMYESSQ